MFYQFLSEKKVKLVDKVMQSTHLFVYLLILEAIEIQDVW